MAERVEIVAELEALETHCRAPLMSVEQRQAWMRDWCDDLAEFPIEAIRLACRDWRRGQDRKFPLPGQLLPLVRAKVSQRQEGDADNKPWEPLSDLAYDALSLSEKVRHQKILGAEALRKAGPQWANGKPVAADDMPSDWHTWRRTAANHFDEAKRLEGKLRASRSAA